MHKLAKLLVSAAAAVMCITTSAAEVLIYPFGSTAPPTVENPRPPSNTRPLPPIQGMTFEIFTNGLALDDTRMVLPFPPAAPIRGIDASLRGSSTQPNPSHLWVFSLENLDDAEWRDFHISLEGAGIGCSMFHNATSISDVSYGSRGATTTFGPFRSCFTTLSSIFNPGRGVKPHEVLDITLRTVNTGGIAVLSNYHLEVLPTFVPEPATSLLILAGLIATIGIPAFQRKNVLPS